ncbi:MAG: toll/interleukin-1 receptor domain-containing protein [Rhizobacter sp.]|nr:toll/interleukin-1 receptor domain-containing protein [Rhizobacter sp.]
MKLFISYRRSDSTHAAHRVRMSLQARFGADAVFIDREIPAGRRWEDHLESMLEESTGVVVMVGDEFLRLLRKGQARVDDAPDALVWEIATAIRLRKAIYPVLFGSIDMPDRTKLPEEMREFAGYQAVFAREPAFDAAMGVLIKSIAAEHGWVDTEAPASAVSSAGSGEKASALRPDRVLAMLGLALLAFASMWWAGRLILWLAHPQAGIVWPAESAFWHGARYALATALWGLGPYLAYWLVAELRARARLPIFNLHGVLTACNVGGILVTGGTHLLLSTMPGWRLEPVWFFPTQPTPAHYVGLSLVLLAMAIAAVAVAVWEPRVRALEAARRAWGMRVVHGVSFGLVACVLWFAASLANSLPPLGQLDPVPVVGYLMLCPALSLLVAAWQYGLWHSGLGERVWQFRYLFYLVLGLYLVCTLALFAYGPTRLLAPDI